MTDRIPQWRAALTASLLASAETPYRPGTMDCLILASRARGAMTGVDPMAPWVGRYETVAAGLALARLEGIDPFALVVEGLVPIAPLAAQMGDIARLEGVDGLPAMGVVVGETIATVSPRGRAWAPLTAAVAAWRV